MGLMDACRTNEMYSMKISDLHTYNHCCLYSYNINIIPIYNSGKRTTLYSEPKKIYLSFRF